MISSFISQKGRRVIDGQNHQVEITIVVVVAESSSPAGPDRGLVESELIREICKAKIPAPPKQEVLRPVGLVRGLYLRENVTVGNKQVQVAVIVEVEEKGRPSGPAGRMQAPFPVGLRPRLFPVDRIKVFRPTSLLEDSHLQAPTV